MTRFRTSATPPDPAEDADRLGDAWDAIVAGRRPSVADEEAELLAVVGQLSAEATPIRPTLTFRNSLRETLMHTAPTTAALPAPTFRPLPKLGRPVEIGQPLRPTATALPDRVRATALRWAAIAATIALLLATAGGGYLATRGPGAGDPTRVAGFQFQDGTPITEPRVASPVAGGYIDPCGGAAPYFPCTGPGPLVGIGSVVGSLYDPDVTAGITEFEMQGWTVEPGQTVSLSSASSTPVPGIGVDIVTAGAYAATFSGPVTVSRTGPLVTFYEYPSAGTRVELSKGDAVSYAFGTRTEIVNPLETQPLTFKSLAFASVPAASAATPQPSGIQSVEGDARVVVDGRGTLPQALDEYDNGDMQIWLTYSQLDPARPFPPTIDSGAVVLGPVDPQYGPEGTEGYIVWAVQPQG